MKKLILTMVLLTGIVLAGKTQFLLRGAVIASGSLSLKLEKDKQEFVSTSSEDNHTDLSVNPFIGYFVIDNLAVGGGLDIGMRKRGEYSESSMAIMPTARYYINEGLFAQGSFGFGSTNAKPSPGIEVKYGMSLWRIGAGYSIRITDTILLDPFISYGATVLNNKDDAAFTRKITRSGVWAGLSFTLIVID